MTRIPHEVALPPPLKKSAVSLEETVLKRRSVRSYKDQPISLQELSQLVWAAQGITSPDGLRAAPSAGALYPLEVFVIVGTGTVGGLEAGVFHYKVKSHSLTLHLEGDLRAKLAAAALDQSSVASAPIDIAICAVFERTARKYDARAERYVHMETGHAGQNVCLQATAQGLGAVTIGAFHDDDVASLMELPPATKPLYIIPVGRL
ncbi:MAG: SagB/ThcOx family dehydrogenase [Chloroflexota bacterium]